MRALLLTILAAGCADDPCATALPPTAQLTVGAAESVAALPGFSAEPGAGEAAWSFERVVLDEVCGPAYVETADLDADGAAEILLSSFGESGGLKLPYGALSVYAGAADDWAPSPVFTPERGLRFPNQARAADVDGDADLDLLAPIGFFVCEIVPFHDVCGGFLWFEQDGGGWVEHELVAPGDALFYHDAVVGDLDGDGAVDLLTVAERRGKKELSFAEAQLFRGDGAGFDPAPHTLAEGLGGLVTGADPDGDGDVDLVSSEFFADLDSFAWLEQLQAPDAAGPGLWERHVIAADVGPAIQMVWVPDLAGDGVARAVGSNHTNTVNKEPDPEESAVIVYTPGADPRQPWSGAQISAGVVSLEGTGKAAPGALDFGDVDGDGDLDLVVSGDGDPRLFLYEQAAPGVFAQRVLDVDLESAGGLKLEDLDGDGADEILVPAYSANALLLYRRVR